MGGRVVVYIGGRGMKMGVAYIISNLYFVSLFSAYPASHSSDWAQFGKRLGRLNPMLGHPQSC